MSSLGPSTQFRIDVDICLIEIGLYTSLARPRRPTFPSF